MEKTGQIRDLRDKSNLKNDLRGEPVLDKNGNKIKVEITEYDEFGQEIFILEMEEKMTSMDNNFETFAKELNDSFHKYEINNSIRKIHFLAQAYVETQRFLKTYEGNPSSSVSGGELYRGRGFLQLTHDYNYKDCYRSLYGKFPTEEELKSFVPNVAKSMQFACEASAWYWKN